MKRILAVAVITIASLTPAQGQTRKEESQAKLRVADEAAIMKVLDNSDKGWDERNAQLAAMDYADDADWMNAFGVQVKGRVNIQEFFAGLLQNAAVTAGSGTKAKTSIRFIRPDVALLYSSFEVIGQKTASGKEMAVRKIHNIRVLTREKGKWLIVSHQIMDEKERLP